ncbi:Glyoxylase, beta-lactamase superfamily II [Amycolatopsis sacchari]|uniref:Glyoxylase, beta-lactamase superfamily II n=1 Tax=Amycolatopsis sacchari TaxID=115433 RepID=A0A1I3R3W8_9PSEU|nr:N-acyl homoserine lactonase family protein [Amycolatopsis sacchari]SFJ40805.1 Glyoxylase, beta-lactamase superfamily II [Amycolatopsis sacchari]
MTGFEVVQVRYGERVTRKSAVLHEYASYGQPDGDLQMDYNFWVLRDGSRIVLLDTGYDITERDWLGEQPVISTPDALRLLDVDPLDVSTVVTSHFHYDHIGHLGLFANAEVVSGVAEHEYWFGKWHRGELDGEFATAGHLEAVWRAEKEGRLRLVTEETEVAPGLTVIPVGGHSPGELLTIVESRSGPLIMAADAAHFYEQIENEWPFFAFTDLDEMRRALALINRLAEERNATVIPGHDGRVRDRFPALGGPAAAVATVLG